MNLPLERQYFYREIDQPDAAINLERAALYLALEAYPDLDVEAYLNALDSMATEVEERLPAEPYPLRILQTINQYLYDDLGFVGNSEDYYDPRNSFLNQVIDRRRGIPITLSLVYLAIAHRLDFAMVGIGMPGHFLIRPTVEEMEVFVDPFNRGEILFAQDCEQRLHQIFGQPVPLQPAFLEPVTNRHFLARMLTNLKAIYTNQGDLENALAAVERILLLFPKALLERRDRGILYYQLQRWPEAQQDLETYLEQTPIAEDELFIRQILQMIDDRE